MLEQMAKESGEMAEKLAQIGSGGAALGQTNGGTRQQGDNPEDHLFNYST